MFLVPLDLGLFDLRTPKMEIINYLRERQFNKNRKGSEARKRTFIFDITSFAQQ